MTDDREHRVDQLGAYADGELTDEESRAVEAHLRVCTECARELALIRALGGTLRQSLSEPPGRGVWAVVQRRVARPLAWVLITAGVAVWVALAALEWYRQRSLTAEWLAASAVVIGLVLLGVGVAFEQYGDWKRSPYKDVER